jgi:FkbM family methyltransferase
MSVVRPEWTVYEVGTHVGYFTLLLARLARRVVGLEPALGNLARTARNLASNGIENTLLVGAAAASMPGSASFVTDTHSGAAGGLQAFHHGEHAGPVITVPTVRLDALADCLGRPGLVKIDAEGAEHDVLAGMGKLLDLDIQLLVEVGTDTGPLVQDRLRDLGFTIFNPHAGMVEQFPGTYAGWHVYARRR